MRAPLVATDIRGDLVGLLPKLRRFARTLTGDAAEADELVQTVCQRAVVKIHLWNSEDRLDSWLYTMARHLWIEEQRRNRARSAAGRHPVAATDDPALSNVTSIMPREGQRAIAALPEGLASLFLLIDVENHTYKQAADILGIPISTVPTRLAAARLHFASTSRNRFPKRP